ncbi:MAG: 23S rRNA (guanosine(2251)-2'-O)-methyltransferase RlmB [Tissierellales bacterium]|jgi:23S rRNA (guanosine2251-2'-O)-methyltransferase|nr:23S rRNA (guanosine(2251)-2'-O)-methyltransferase RlmB [Tissierellales bacterium]
MKQDLNFIYGRNAVIEVLKTGRPVDQLIIVNGNLQGSIKQIVAMAKEKKILVKYVPRTKLDEMAEGKNHQGVIAKVAAHQYSELKDIFALAEKKGEAPFIIILDGIEDPHNLGAILRTAECAGAHGVIVAKRRAVGLTEVVAKTAAGAIEHIPVVKATNIVQTIQSLKEKGVWIYGADMDGEKQFFEQDMTGAMGLVIGNEGKGMSRLVKESCDFIVRIPLKGFVTSLNASVAGSVLMYEVVRQRMQNGK